MQCCSQASLEHLPGLEFFYLIFFFFFFFWGGGPPASIENFSSASNETLAEFYRCKNFAVFVLG